MARTITTGIDIGTYQVKVVITERLRKNGRYYPKIIGTGIAESKGLRHGYIINSADVTRSVGVALHQAEKTAGIKVRKVFISVGGIGLDAFRTKGDVFISRADSEIVDLDVSKALAESEQAITAKITNRKVLHAIPVAYWVDNEPVLGSPSGMKGSKLSIETLFVTCLERHLNDLIQATEEAGVDVVDVMASPLAGSLVMLTKAQKIAGCVLANIGAETVSIVVFEDNIPISLKVFPIGSTDITNDIALGLRISLEEAEQIKRGAITGTVFPKKKLDDIILARLSDIFELIDSHLQEIGKSGMLPAGIVLTGGGSGVSTIEDLARAILKLPSKIAHVGGGSENPRLRDASWAVAYGLCLWGFQSDEEGDGIAFAKKTSKTLLDWIKQFLP